MTVYVLIFAASGGAYAIVQTAVLPAMLAFTALIIAFGAVLLGVNWLNEITGANHALYYFWQNLAGVPTPNDVVIDCPPSSEVTWGNFFWSIVLVVLTLINVPIGLAAFCVAWIAVIGVGLTLIGSIVAIAYAIAGKLQQSILLIGLGTVALCMIPAIAAGLMIRLEHYVSYALTC